MTMACEDLAREALAPEGVLPLRVNEMTPSVIICAEGSRISIQWREQRPDQPNHDEYGRAEAMAAFLVEAANRHGTAYDAIGSGVKVRALEWDEHGSAKALGLRYEVWLHRDVADGYKERWLAAQINGATDRLGGFDSRDEAKAAAQADFERRVLSCLSPVAVEEADAKAVGPWHGMASAPRDGTYILASGLDFGTGPRRHFTVCLCLEGTDTFVEAEGGEELTYLDAWVPLPGAALLSPHTAAGAGPVGETVVWRVDNLTAAGKTCGDFVLYASYDRVEVHLQKHGALSCKVTPLYASPQEPGEVERLTRELRMIVSHATAGRTDGAGMSVNDVSVAITALRNDLWQEARKKPEAALAETRERLEKDLSTMEREARWDMGHAKRKGDHSEAMCKSHVIAALGELRLRAALTGDAQEAGR